MPVPFLYFEISTRNRQNIVDELVVFQESQTLPLFLVKLKPNAKFERKSANPPPFSLQSEKQEQQKKAEVVDQIKPEQQIPEATIEQRKISKAEFMELEPTDVIKTFKEVGKLRFPPNVDQIILNEYLDNKAFMIVTKEDLKALGIPTGPATTMVDFVAQLS